MTSNIGKTGANVKIDKFFELLDTLKGNNEWQGHTITAQTKKPLQEELITLFELIINDKAVANKDLANIRTKLEGLNEPRNNENFKDLLLNLQSRVENPSDHKGIKEKQKERDNDDLSDEGSLENKDSAPKDNSTDPSDHNNAKQKDEKDISDDIRKAEIPNTAQPQSSQNTNNRPIRRVKKIRVDSNTSTNQTNSNPSKGYVLAGLAGVVAGVSLTAVFGHLISPLIATPAAAPVPVQPQPQEPYKPHPSFTAKSQFCMSVPQKTQPSGFSVQPVSVCGEKSKDLNFIRATLESEQQKDAQLQEKQEQLVHVNTNNAGLKLANYELLAGLKEISEKLDKIIQERKTEGTGFNDAVVRETIRTALELDLPVSSQKNLLELNKNIHAGALFLADLMVKAPCSNKFTLKLAQDVAVKYLKSSDPLIQKYAIRIYAYLLARKDDKTSDFPLSLSKFLADPQTLLSSNLNDLINLINSAKIDYQELRMFVLFNNFNAKLSKQHVEFFDKLLIENLIQKGDIASASDTLKQLSEIPSDGLHERMEIISYAVIEQYGASKKNPFSESASLESIKITAAHFCAHFNFEKAFNLMNAFYAQMDNFNGKRQEELLVILQGSKFFSVTDYSSYHGLTQSLVGKVDANFLMKMDAAIIGRLPITTTSTSGDAFDILSSFAKGVKKVNKEQINLIFQTLIKCSIAAEDNQQSMHQFSSILDAKGVSPAVQHHLINIVLSKYEPFIQKSNPKIGYSILNNFLLGATPFDLVKGVPGFVAQEKNKQLLATLAGSVAHRVGYDFKEVNAILTNLKKLGVDQAYQASFATRILGKEDSFASKVSLKKHITTLTNFFSGDASPNAVVGAPGYAETVILAQTAIRQINSTILEPLEYIVGLQNLIQKFNSTDQDVINFSILDKQEAIYSNSNRVSSQYQTSINNFGYLKNYLSEFVELSNPIKDRLVRTVEILMTRNLFNIHSSHHFYEKLVLLDARDAAIKTIQTWVSGQNTATNFKKELLANIPLLIDKIKTDELVRLVIEASDVVPQSIQIPAYRNSTTGANLTRAANATTSRAPYIKDAANTSTEAPTKFALSVGQSSALKESIQEFVNFVVLDIDEVIIMNSIAHKLDPTFKLSIPKERLADFAQKLSPAENQKLIQNFKDTQNIAQLTNLLNHLAFVEAESLTNDIAISVKIFGDRFAGLADFTGREPTEVGSFPRFWEIAGNLANLASEVKDYAWQHAPNVKELIRGVQNTHDDAISKNRLALQGFEHVLTRYPDQAQNIAFKETVWNVLNRHSGNPSNFEHSMNLLITFYEISISTAHDQDVKYKESLIMQMPKDAKEIQNFVSRYGNKVQSYDVMIKYHHLLMQRQDEQSAYPLKNIIENAIESKTVLSLQAIAMITDTRKAYGKQINKEFNKFLINNSNSLFESAALAPKATTDEKLFAWENLAESFKNNMVNHPNALEGLNTILDHVIDDTTVTSINKIRTMIKYINEYSAKEFRDYNIERLIKFFYNEMGKISTVEQLGQLKQLKEIVRVEFVAGKKWAQDEKIIALLDTEEKTVSVVKDKVQGKMKVQKKAKPIEKTEQIKIEIA